MGDRDAPADSRGAQVLTPLQHLVQHALGFLVEPEQPDQLPEEVVLGSAFEVQLDGVGREELDQSHAARNVRPKLEMCQTGPLSFAPCGSPIRSATTFPSSWRPWRACRRRPSGASAARSGLTPWYPSSSPARVSGGARSRCTTAP